MRKRGGPTSGSVSAGVVKTVFEPCSKGVPSKRKQCGQALRDLSFQRDGRARQRQRVQLRPHRFGRAQSVAGHGVERRSRDGVIPHGHQFAGGVARFQIALHFAPLGGGAGCAPGDANGRDPLLDLASEQRGEDADLATRG